MVWEHLATVDGDTQFVDSEFRPFQPHAAAVAAEPGSAPAAEFEQQGRTSGVCIEGIWVTGVDLLVRGARCLEAGMVERDHAGRSCRLVTWL